MSSRPLLLYDGDCAFCRRWIDHWKSLTGDRVEYTPFQTVQSQFPQIPAAHFEASVQLIEPSGEIFSGAHAVFRTLSYAPGRQWMLWIYRHVPGAALISEWFYRLITDHRVAFSRIVRWLWGDHAGPATYGFSHWLFLRLVGLIYAAAFMSLWPQISGLVGRNGILPASEFLEAVRQQAGPVRYLVLPTLCWIDSSDFFLKLLCGTGAILSVLVVGGLAISPIFFVLWLFYLSLTTVGQDFLSFQWDALLLETGFLAIFFSPPALPARIARQEPPRDARSGRLDPADARCLSRPPRLVLWLLNWLLFRLMFASGVVKLSSHDATWQTLTALDYHYETQPLPVWTSWYVHQLPGWFQKCSVAGMFAIELFLPFLIFAPCRLRMTAFFGLVALQILIMATGNYCFFNLLTIALAFLLVDDASWPQVLRKKAGLLRQPGQVEERAAQIWPRQVLFPLAVFIMFLSLVQMPRIFRVRAQWPVPIILLQRLAAPLHLVNTYGLFAVMTTSRPEIIVEGSENGQDWRAYEFKHKPGDLKRRPRFVAPHQPRLDWQMWFAALGRFQENPWFLNFCLRLLQGTPEVLDLLKKNPFPGKPPRYIRAVVYDYHFTHHKARSLTGAWWRRDGERPYLPVLSLRD